MLLLRPLLLVAVVSASSYPQQYARDSHEEEAAASSAEKQQQQQQPPRQQQQQQQGDMSLQADQRRGRRTTPRPDPDAQPQNSRGGGGGGGGSGRRRNRQREEDTIINEDDDDHSYRGQDQGEASCCDSLDEIREQKKELLKRKILQKLKLKTPPPRPSSFRGLPNIPDLNEDFNERPPMDSEALPDSEDTAITQKIIILGERPPPALGLRSLINPGTFIMENIIFFNFSEDVIKSKISKATFGIYLRNYSQASYGMNGTQLLIYRLKRRNGQQSQLDRDLLEKKVIKFNSDDTGKWHMFSFKRPMIDWLHSGHENLGLEVQAQDGDGYPLAVLHSDDEDGGFLKNPYIELHIDEDSKGRSKRMMSTGLNCKDDSNVTLCCRYNLVADFAEFGYDFIIAPRRYTAFFCAGNCPFYFNPANTHSHVSKVAKKDVASCCTGTKLTYLKLIYFDKFAHIRVDKLPNMKVQECGCA